MRDSPSGHAAKPSQSLPKIAWGEPGLAAPGGALKEAQPELGENSRFSAPSSDHSEMQNLGREIPAGLLKTCPHLVPSPECHLQDSKRPWVTSGASSCSRDRAGIGKQLRVLICAPESQPGIKSQRVGVGGTLKLRAGTFPHPRLLQAQPSLAWTLPGVRKWKKTFSL